ncbi:helix-turn-helix domain-containing protein [Bacillus sp. FJAT-42315]|uniref:helix-turn-helix domain-containing protein n=1 Tax=Bacillus sp. FJAT-42315 TaxID=2014077 RepID=UPI000B9EAAB9|nr:helix-turn-helix transcriptional regulator [Bacillus sp. FJAT-42315]OZI10347.1 transcriptional regulator [Bacillaceae bacterium SAS-127]PAQ14835.1 transcriptional regulator [Bacillaceae bacterium SAOS 7]
METDQWGRRIRAFRKLKGFTQEELAHEIGVPVSALGDVERGYRPITEQLLQQIAEVLQVRVDELSPPDK